MYSGLLWCSIYNSDGVKVSHEDLFSVDLDGWEDAMMNTENAIVEYLDEIMPKNDWQFEIGADAFSGMLDYSLTTPLPEIPPFTFTLRDKDYTIHFPKD